MERLLFLGAFYDIEKLKHLAEDRLIQGLNKDNVVQYLELAALLNAQNLKAAVTRWILTNLAAVSATKKWKAMILMKPKVAISLLEKLAGHYTIIPKLNDTRPSC